MSTLKFFYHAIISEIYILIGNALIYLEPGTKGSRTCAQMAKKHHDICKELIK